MSMPLLRISSGSESESDAVPPPNSSLNVKVKFLLRQEVNLVKILYQ